MADRKGDRVDRKIPCGSFIIPINLRFSFSMKWEEYQDFSTLLRNRREDSSRIIREFIFKRLGVKDIFEFEKKYYREMEVIKKKILTDLSPSPEEKVILSELIEIDIRNCMEEAKKNVGLV